MAGLTREGAYGRVDKRGAYGRYTTVERHMAGYTMVERHMAGYTQGGIWPGIHRWHMAGYTPPGIYLPICSWVHPTYVHTVLHVYAATPGVGEESPGLKRRRNPWVEASSLTFCSKVLKVLY